MNITVVSKNPADGPALLVFSDGKTVGAGLDRNGLRPARYSITKDGYVVVSSEAGVVDLPEAEIIEKGRLAPGQMIAVDLQNKEILKNWEIKERIAKKNPYGEWIASHRQGIRSELFSEETLFENAETVLQQQTAFGCTAEDLEMVIISMATQGKEPTFCMGDDTPLAILSSKPRLLYDYFKQRFAQVTNPPIDPLRESLVMSLNMSLGERGKLLEPKPESAKLLRLESPFLNELELAEVKASGLDCTELSTLFEIETGPDGLEKALANLVQMATDAVNSGAKILILSDRPNNQTLSETSSFIPPLLAVGAVHHHLIREGLRLQASLVVDTAQCWSTHHFACLIGYGASAICPYLALESVRQWWHDPRTQNLMENGKIDKIALPKALVNYRKSVEAGLLKILSKMGISLLASYHGAQIFEAIGLGPELVELAFAGTTSRVGGLNLSEVAQEVMTFHAKAFPSLTTKKLENYGFVNYRPSGEYHMNSPAMSKALHKAVQTFRSPLTPLDKGGNEEAYNHYEVYRKHLEGRPVTALRDLLDLNSDRDSIPLEEVESVENIVKRFCTGGMSLGALSREAHETLAIAMNRLGAKSNSGEGEKILFVI